jgi:hypothetical protein
MAASITSQSKLGDLPIQEGFAMAERKPATSKGFTAEERGTAERLHALISASAPDLSPRTWYGMPAYARDGQVVCFVQNSQKFKTRYARSASATKRTSTRATCGRRPSR